MNMLRNSPLLRCPPSKVSTEAGVASTPSRKSTTKPHSSFRLLPTPSWQLKSAAAWESSRRGAGSGKMVELPRGISFHGKRLGPRPILVIGGAVPTVGAAADQAERFSHMLSQAAWEHGAIHVPIIATSATAMPTLLTEVSDQIVTLLDMLSIGWTHTLCHSLGALVAAKMSLLHPTRAGTLLVLDSQIVEKQWIANDKARDEIAKAQNDVNVPEAMLAFRIEELRQHVEPTITPSDVQSGDAAIFNDVLFSSSHLFGQSGGLVRHDASYLSIDELNTLRHPIQLIVPSANGVCDVPTHKDFFNLRRVQPIKSCSAHAELFAPSGGSGAAEEVGAVVEQWVQRYEPDTIMLRRYEAAAKEMKQRMGTGDAPSGAPAAKSAEDGGDKKKEKRKKGKQ